MLIFFLFFSLFFSSLSGPLGPAGYALGGFPVAGNPAMMPTDYLPQTQRHHPPPAGWSQEAEERKREREREIEIDREMEIDREIEIDICGSATLTCPGIFQPQETIRPPITTRGAGSSARTL
jgi:hypothetical protein